MYLVTYITYLGGIESQACRRFSNGHKAKAFARAVNGIVEKRVKL